MLQLQVVFDIEVVACTLWRSDDRRILGHLCEMRGESATALVQLLRYPG
jgi:hypothetical protein